MDNQAYLQDLISDLQALVQIPSVRDDQSAGPGQPFGQEINRALTWLEHRAQALGLATKNLAGYGLLVQAPGQAIKTNQPDRVDIVSHLDVVPVGLGWTRDPFGAQIVDGRMYGRGTSDMKAAALTTLYALKQISDQNPAMKRPIRLVFGTDEETDMADLTGYIATYGPPSFALTPDAHFPIGIGEKGATTWQISLDLPADSCLSSLAGGDAANSVASWAQFDLPLASKDQALAYLASQSQLDWDYEEVGQAIRVTIKGRGAHASQPELGQNALVQALACLADLTQEDQVKALSQAFADYRGRGLDLERSSKEMGHLTINLGTARSQDQKLHLQIDSRFPNGVTSDEITDQLYLALPDAEIWRTFDTPAILLDQDRPGIQILQKRYADNFPGQPQEAQINGAVTYSKIIPIVSALALIWLVHLTWPTRLMSTSS
ncbi:hypothetical protein AWM75_03060 [Aerococcus urinaehominis]|uniref:Uncharacterized protein n=1 Tax=Aerococcus urinaehominis TaxID=128944 RepID=A0A109RGD8_9LACT|nr:Sapep family Mn(2+)-dependent dipeptidase [Aerococcus urinaehominis]AMB99040.1 hypothetical protein AWM75_03060 [Aerococcus urinaehominis]SDM50759.1 succinyl-diaminopimelate desuccinylase [Aerococcus urinaehominis]